MCIRRRRLKAAGPTAPAVDLLRRAAAFVPVSADTRSAPWTRTGLDEDVAGAPPRRRRQSGSSEHRGEPGVGQRTSRGGAPAKDFRITDGRTQTSSRARSALVSRCVVAVQLTRGPRPQNGGQQLQSVESRAKGRAASEGGGSSWTKRPILLRKRSCTNQGPISPTGKAGSAATGCGDCGRPESARGITPRRGRNLSDHPLVAIIENSVNLRGPHRPRCRGQGYRFPVSPSVSGTKRRLSYKAYGEVARELRCGFRKRTHRSSTS